MNKIKVKSKLGLSQLILKSLKGQQLNENEVYAINSNKVDGLLHLDVVQKGKSNSKQDVKIVAVDAAGNEQPIEITDFLVNDNFFVRWYNNTPLFIGSIIGVVVIALGAVTLILFGKKKKKDDK